MKQVKMDDIRFLYLPSDQVRVPLEIQIPLDGEKDITRGQPVKFEGSEGVIFDLSYDPYEDWDNTYTVSIFWFRGPLSGATGESQNVYSLEEFLKFREVELLDSDGS